MPKRSNEFQRLIFAIEKALAGDSATVVESSEVLDRTTGKLREVDILITRRVGQRELRISVECRDHGRRQGSEWIEQLVAKRADLNLDRVVAVSRSGFTAPAIKKAAFHGIEAMTLNRAIATDWESAFDGLEHMSVSEFRGDVKHVQVVAPDEPQDVTLVMGESMSCVIINGPDGARMGTLQDMANYVANLESVHDRVEEAAVPDEPHAMAVTVRFDEGTRLTDAVGTSIGIRALEFHVLVTRHVTYLPIERADYGSARVGIVSSNAGGFRHAVVFVQEPNQGTEIRLITLPENPPHDSRK